MNPVTLVIMVLLAPFLLAFTLLVPTYAGIVVAAYIIYDKGAKVHPLADKLDNVLYMLDVYTKMFWHWEAHMGETSFLGYSLPLLLPPVIGVFLSYWLTGKLIRGLKNMFPGGMN